MAERESALKGHYRTGRFGETGEPGVLLTEVPIAVLQQIAAWPDTVETVAARTAQAAGADPAPGPGAAVAGSRGVVMRIEPLKWWLYGVAAPGIEAEEGATLDLSHARTQVRVSGSSAADCLNRLIPLDLRSESFPVDAAAATGMHHVGITLWHSREGYELFLPRGFAVSLWEVLLDTAMQFGVEVQ